MFSDFKFVYFSIVVSTAWMRHFWIFGHFLKQNSLKTGSLSLIGGWCRQGVLDDSYFQVLTLLLVALGTPEDSLLFRVTQSFQLCKSSTHFYVDFKINFSLGRKLCEYNNLCATVVHLCFIFFVIYFTMKMIKKSYRTKFFFYIPSYTKENSR